MPTASANVGSTAGDAVLYAMQEKKKGVPEDQKAVVFECNQVFGSAREIGFQMKDVSDDRPAVKKTVLHLQINFHPEEHPSPVQAKAAIDSILKDIGIEKDNHQYVVVQHRDKPHDHYHVVANRVGLDGSLVNDHRIIDRLQVACSKAEQELELRPTPGRTVVYDETAANGFRYVKAEISADPKEVKSKNPKIKEIQSALIEILKVATTPAALVEGLRRKNIEVQFSQKDDGTTFGVGFRADGVSVKGTAVGYKWKQIDAILSTNAALTVSAPILLPEREAATRVIDQAKPPAAPEKTKEQELIACIQENASKIPDPIHLADHAIRAVFASKEGEVYENAWTAFRESKEFGALSEEQRYDKVYDLAVTELKINPLIVLAPAVAIISKERELITFIQENASKISDPIQLADQAIRVVFSSKDSEMRISPWVAFAADRELVPEADFEKFGESKDLKMEEARYNLVYQYAEAALKIQGIKMVPLTEKAAPPVEEPSGAAPVVKQQQPILPPAQVIPLIAITSLKPDEIKIEPAPIPKEVRVQIQNYIEARLDNWKKNDVDSLVSRAIEEVMKVVNPESLTPAKDFEEYADSKVFTERMEDNAISIKEDQEREDQQQRRGPRR